MSAWVILFIYIFSVYGFTNMLVYLNGPFGIFEKIRKIANSISEQLGELFSCMACCSTWVGILFSLVNAFILPAFAFTPGYLLFGTDSFSIMALFVDMIFTSGVVWIIHNVEEFFERGFQENDE